MMNNFVSSTSNSCSSASRGESFAHAATKPNSQEVSRVKESDRFTHLKSTPTPIRPIFSVSSTSEKASTGSGLRSRLPSKEFIKYASIKPDYSMFASPTFMIPQAPVESSHQLSDTNLSNLTDLSFRNNLAALTLVDAIHTLMARSVPQNMLRRHLCRRRMSRQKLKELPVSVSRVSKRRGYKSARGIRNYGQTCFLNSILQSLASLEPFLMYLERVQNVSNFDQSSHNVGHHLFMLLQMINGQRDGNLDPRQLLKTVGKKYAQFRSTGREQQDAHEFLQALIEMIIEEADIAAVSLGNTFMSLSKFLSEIEKDESFAHRDVTVTCREFREHESTSICLDASNSSGEEKKQEDLVLRSSPYRKEITSNDEITEQSLDLGSLIIDVDTDDSRGYSMFDSLSVSSPSPFHGWIGSTLQCAKCKHVRPIQNAPFLDIGVVPTSVSKYINEGNFSSQPSKESPSSRFPSCTLAECLERYCEVERVKGVDCRQCTLKKEIALWEDEALILRGAVKSLLERSKLEPGSAVQLELLAIEDHIGLLRSMDPDEADEIPACQLSSYGILSHPTVVLCRGDALKCLLLTRLPTVLCVHVQRRYYDPRLDSMAKTIQHVEFDEIMDFGKYCAYSGNDQGVTGKGDDGRRQIAQPVPFRLVSIVEHSGNAFSGHYVVYRRDLGNPGHWMFVSDEIVKSISWEQVKTREAYMLFYERI